MAQAVQEIMNRELFSVRGHEKAHDVSKFLLQLGVSAAPVLDDAHRPIGFLSLRDVLQGPVAATVSMLMTAPADHVRFDDSIEAVADVLCSQNRHHLVVVDEDGRAIGFVGALDVLRALRGRPVQHPDSFPHYDPSTGLRWNEPREFDDEAVAEAPSGPGLFALTLSELGQPDRVVWSEASANLRLRLDDLLHTPRSVPPHLLPHIEHGRLFVRTACSPRAISSTSD